MQLLSHYTSEHGFIGIARSKSLWATEFLALNDRVEFVYAMSAIWEEALSQALPRIPRDLRDPAKTDEILRAQLPEYLKALRKQVAESDGYGSVYVASFARGRSEDEDEQGILTLWDRYTRNEGYCVQFAKKTMRRLVDCETHWCSYVWVELAEVKYGIDRNDDQFRRLAEQFANIMLLRCFQETHDHRIAPDPAKLNVDLRELLSFCGRHKDPSFVDEREMRIFACPVNVAGSGVLTGVTMSKIIYRRSNRLDGARYIVLGEFWLPGAIPDRIIIGPKAKWRDYVLDQLYPPPPTIRKSTIPIR